jgi:hypothetical protein
MPPFRLALPLALLVLPGLTPPGSPAAEAPFRYPPGKHGQAELQYVNHLPVLTVAGSPDDIGEAVGILALRPGSRVLTYPRGLLRALDVDRAWNFFLSTGKGMYKGFPADYSQETEAIVKGAKCERDLVIAGNTFFDVKKVIACSAVVVEKEKSATGGPLLARNLDYPSLGYIHQYSLVTVYRPRGKHAFASVGFPGLVGVLSGMNDAGLTVAVHEVFDVKAGEAHFDVKGIPYALCLRRVLEECSTIGQAKNCLEKMRRTTTINVAVADREHVGVLEVTPGRVLLRKPSGGTCTCTNHYCTPTLKPEKPVNIDRSFERFAKLEEVRGWQGKVTVEGLRKQLDEANLGKLTLQTMAFEPATLKFHLSIGKTPASQGPFRTLDLGSLFKAGKRDSR